MESRSPAKGQVVRRISATSGYGTLLVVLPLTNVLTVKGPLRWAASPLPAKPCQTHSLNRLKTLKETRKSFGSEQRKGFYKGWQEGKFSPLKQL